jgi:hypothetical protein
MNTDDLIREALGRQADRAPAPGAVLAALRRPARRGRPLALAVVAVVGVLVLAAGVVALRQNLAEPLPPAAPSLQVEYSPTWLPDGFAEQGRSYSPDGVFLRTWAPEPLVPKEQVWAWGPLRLEMRFERHRDDLVPADVVGGVTGVLSTSEEDRSTTFTWLPDRAVGTAVSVVVVLVPDPLAVLEQVVRSTRPDSTTSSVPLMVGPGTYSVRGTPDDWSVQVTRGRWEDLSFEATLTPRQPFLDGVPVEVRGALGIAHEYGLAVQVAPDRWLSVRTAAGATTPITRDRLVSIADTARIAPNPDVSWLGKR